MDQDQPIMLDTMFYILDKYRRKMKRMGAVRTTVEDY